jgi:hypothetical protein
MDRMPAFTTVLSENFSPVLLRHLPGNGHGFRKRAFALAAAIAAVSFASPAAASPEMSTKLIRCGAESCLVITGHRDNPAAVVSINGQAVSVEGNHGWRARVPVETVRQWSSPSAREIEVSLRDPDTQTETTDSVDLPIGLLGNLTNLASLEVSVR